MEAVFFRPGDAEKEVPETIVGTAVWTRARVEITGAMDDAARSLIARIFRETPVLVEDGSLRTLAGHGPSLIEPGSDTWFRQAAATRAGNADLSVRFVSELRPGEGYDPAAQYTDFRDVVTNQL
jgi:hypothetical protein